MTDRQFIYRTDWSNPDKYHKFTTEPLAQLQRYVEFVLWECSTEFMVNHGLPYEDDVRCWINWIDRREDGYFTYARNLIAECQQYIN